MFLKLKPQGPTFLEIATEKQKFWHGLFMWFLLFFGYMTFCMNWLVMSKLEQGWGTKFGVVSGGDGSGGKSTVLESVNYSLLFARGVATIMVAWFMTKLSHKYAVVVALFLNTIAFPLIFAPNLGLFIAGRMIMACGGTMLIIFIQPILSRFFSLQQKGVLSIFTSFAYVVGALVVNIMFLFPSITNNVKNNWQGYAIIFSALSYLPFLYYWLFGKNFKTTDSQQDEIDQEKLPQNTYSGIIKEQSCWFWIFWYSFLLVASVMVSNVAPKVIEKINSQLVQVGKDYFDWKSLYTICFYSGCFFGFSLGRWNKTRYQRKPFVALCTFLGVIFWAIIALVSKFCTQATTAATVIIFICVFLFAFFSMGIQTVILYIPHEYPENNNAKRITIFYSYLWGIGYIIFAFYSLFESAIRDIQVSGPNYSLATISVFVLMFFLLALCIKEPRPSWRMHPWDRSSVLISPSDKK